MDFLSFGLTISNFHLKIGASCLPKAKAEKHRVRLLYTSIEPVLLLFCSFRMHGVLCIVHIVVFSWNGMTPSYEARNLAPHLPISLVWRPACGFIASTLDDWDCTRTCTRFPSPSFEWLSRTNSEPSCYYCKLCRQGRTLEPFIQVNRYTCDTFGPVPIRISTPNMNTKWQRTLR